MAFLFARDAAEDRDFARLHAMGASTAAVAVVVVLAGVVGSA